MIFRAKSQRQKPRIPQGVRIYAFGDIHGRADLLAETFARIDANRGGFPPAKAIHIYLGDYVDRGPASREVLDLLIERGGRFPSVYLKGNHESYLVEFLKHPDIFAEWRAYGALDTLLSYGVAPSSKLDSSEIVDLAFRLDQALPQAHRVFLKELRLSFTCGDYFFVHAGVRPGISLSSQQEDDLLWIREDFLLHEEPFEKLVVHGHTPVVEPDIRPNRINIDTGAYASGKLTCLLIEQDQMQFI